jgi:hypothetical protein
MRAPARERVKRRNAKSMSGAELAESMTALGVGDERLGELIGRDTSAFRRWKSPAAAWGRRIPNELKILIRLLIIGKITLTDIQSVAARRPQSE